MDELGITDPDPDDHMEFDSDLMLGSATILKRVALEAENVGLEVCDSSEGKDYLLFIPGLPVEPGKPETVRNGRGGC